MLYQAAPKEYDHSCPSPQSEPSHFLTSLFTTRELTMEIRHRILLRHKLSILTNKWLLPTQWLSLHFHKPGPCFSQFSSFVKCVHLLPSDMPIQINLLNFFLHKAIKNPRELSLSCRLIQHKRKSYLHSNLRNHRKCLYSTLS